LIDRSFNITRIKRTCRQWVNIECSTMYKTKIRISLCIRRNSNSRLRHYDISFLVPATHYPPCKTHPFYQNAAINKVANEKWFGTTDHVVGPGSHGDGDLQKEMRWVNWERWWSWWKRSWEQSPMGNRRNMYVS